MEFGLKEFIIAVVTLNKDMVSTGSITPVFYAKDVEHLNNLSSTIARTVDGVVHDLGMDTYIIVKH